MQILLTGATGLIGKQLGLALVRKGHELIVISRDAKRTQQQLPFPCQIIEGDLTAGPLSNQLLKQVEGVIHLAGENVGDGRWTQHKKQKIFDSRVIGTKNLFKTIHGLDSIKCLVSASAIGFYGHRNSDLLAEDSPAGSGFLAEVCQKWEQVLQENSTDIRIVVLRLGLILSEQGGALLKMLTPFQNHLGGVLGSGEQWMSWIHLDDVVQIFIRAIEDTKISGIYNCVAPNPVPNSEFTQLLCKNLSTRQGPAAPAMAIKFLLGEMGELVLNSQKVSSEKLLQTGYQFLYPSLNAALEKSCQNYKEGCSLIFSEQYIPETLENIFSFFSKAENLQEITPKFLDFKIISKSTQEIQPGTLITYSMKLHGFPIQWKTLIKEYVPNKYFIDNQEQGPYSLWYHRHEFERVGNGTLIRDIVKYKLPMGLIGKNLVGAFVAKDVQKIFDYRRKTICKIFPGFTQRSHK